MIFVRSARSRKFSGIGEERAVRVQELGEVSWGEGKGQVSAFQGQALRSYDTRWLISENSSTARLHRDGPGSDTKAIERTKEFKL
jgi:hypothetical protein